jgi:hypothetical protein
MTRSPWSLSAGKLSFSPVGLASFVLVVAGLVLGATVDMAWLVLFGLGAFGPSVLRALGVLADRDEFQREAARRAGHHAYLAGGSFVCAVVVARTAGTRTFGGDEFSASTVLMVMVVTYLLSHLVSFWGATAAAFRVLLAFGIFWLAFVVLAHRGIEMLVESLVALPLFLLAFASRRWPRASGAVLLGLAAFAFWFFNLYRAFRGAQGAWMVILVLVLPLAAMGVALLAARPGEVETAPSRSK